MKIMIIIASVLLVLFCSCSTKPNTEGIITVEGSSVGTDANTENSDICFCHEGTVVDVQKKSDTSYTIIFDNGSFDIDMILYKDDSITGEYCYLYKGMDGDYYVLSISKRTGTVKKCSQCTERK